MILLNGIDNLLNTGNMPPGCDLLLVAEHAPERAGELRDEDRDRVMFSRQNFYSWIELTEIMK